MKKYLYSAFIALFAISCSESEDPLQEITPDIPSNAPESFYAEIPRTESRAIWNTEFVNWDGAASVNSRTYATVDPENAKEFYQYWHEGDAISLFLPHYRSKTKTEHFKYVLQSGKDGDLGKFEWEEDIDPEEISQALTNYTYSIYPYKDGTKDREVATAMTSEGQFTFYFPEMQEYAENSYAQGYNGMIAREPLQNSDDVYEFKNFCSYLQLRLTYADSSKEVDRIILKAKNHHDLISGVGTITYEGDEPVVTMNHELSANEVALDCRNHHVKLDPTTPTNFWFVLPGGFTFTEGFKVTVIFKDGTYFVKEKTYKKNEKPIHILRNHITPMAPFTIGTVSGSSIRYKYENGQNNEFPFKVDENGYCDLFTNEKNEPLKIHQNYNGTEWVITFDGILNNIEANAFDNEKAKAPQIEYLKIENCETIDIKAHAFWNCTADSISIVNDISTIQEQAFGNSDIKSVKIEGDVHDILNDALDFAWNLERIDVEGHIHVIQNGSFSGSNIKNIVVSEKINTIEANAFQGCQNLESITMTDIENIGSGAFYQCKELVTINLEGVKHIGNGAFEQCTSLTNVNIEDAEYIGNGAFSTCTSLTNIRLNNVSEICTSAFSACINLTTIEIGPNCTKISEGVFTMCNSLTNIYIYAETPPTLSHNNGTYKDPYIFPSKATVYVPNVETYNSAASWWWYSTNNPTTEDRASLAAMSTTQQ